MKQGFIAQKNAERKASADTKGKGAPEKKEQAKSFLKEKAKKMAEKSDQPPAANKPSATKEVMKSKAPKEEKKKTVLAEARKKVGTDEGKRADFKKRTEETQAKRKEKAGVKKENPGKAAVASAPAPKMAQRVNQVMEKTGMTRQDAKSTVVARRDARQQQLTYVKEQYGLGQRQARGVVKYANNNKTAATEGATPTADLATAKRVVQMAKNKGLTRKEAAGVIQGRKQARQTPPA